MLSNGSQIHLVCSLLTLEKHEISIKNFSNEKKGNMRFARKVVFHKKTWSEKHEIRRVGAIKRGLRLKSSGQKNMKLEKWVPSREGLS